MYAQEATLLILCNTSEYVCGLLEWRECIQCSQWLFATVFGHLFLIIRTKPVQVHANDFTLMGSGHEHTV